MFEKLNDKMRRMAMIAGLGGASLLAIPAMDGGCNATIDIFIDEPATDSEFYVAEPEMTDWSFGLDDWDYFTGW